MSITVTCSNCQQKIDRGWLRALTLDQPFECPHCGSPLVETACVEVGEDSPRVGEGGGRKEEAA